jgi:putative oxidoreductase
MPIRTVEALLTLGHQARRRGMASAGRSAAFVPLLDEDARVNDRIATPYAACLLRVAMGAMFIAHGLLLKIVEYGAAGTAAYFASIGYPSLIAYLVIAAEIAGGLMLVVGFKVRLVALAFVPLMIGATLEHIPNGWMFGYAGGGYEFPLFWTATLVVQALIGPGAFALDHAGRARPSMSGERAS